MAEFIRNDLAEDEIHLFAFLYMVNPCGIYVEKVTVYENKFTVEFKSGVTIDVEA